MIKLELTTSRVTEQLQYGSTYGQVARMFGVTRKELMDFCAERGIKASNVPRKSDLAVRKDEFPLGPELYAAASNRYLRKKQNCKNQKKEFTVSMQDITWHTHCPILGIELDYWCVEGMRQDNSVSFDQIKPGGGYVPGNVQVVSWRGNRIKNDGTAEEHERVAQYIRAHS